VAIINQPGKPTHHKIANSNSSTAAAAIITAAMRTQAGIFGMVIPLAPAIYSLDGLSESLDEELYPFIARIRYKSAEPQSPRRLNR
jgi:hypothetical protein